MATFRVFFSVGSDYGLISTPVLQFRIQIEQYRSLRNEKQTTGLGEVSGACMCSISLLFLGVLAKERKAAVAFFHVYPSARMKHLGSYWMMFHEILVFYYFSKICRENTGFYCPFGPGNGHLNRSTSCMLNVNVLRTKKVSL